MKSKIENWKIQILNKFKNLTNLEFKQNLKSGFFLKFDHF
jgi:hypothetical protein